MKRRCCYWILLCSAAILLSACGQTGKLYLPASPPQQTDLR